MTPTASAAVGRRGHVFPTRVGERVAVLARVVALTLVVCVAAAAAGGGGAASGARAGGSIRIGIQLEPPVLDPTVNPAAAISSALYDNLYEGLVEFGADGSVRPRLAESWTISDDGLTYTFNLHPGVHFHNGVSFDASTAKFALERARAPGSVNPQRSRLAAIGAIDVLDPLTLRIRLTRRSGGLLQSLAFGALVMVEPKSAASNAQTPVGTGPFRFGVWRRGDSLRLERNRAYWGQPAPLDAATFKFIADPTAAYAALMAGDIDAFDNYPAPESFAQFAADPRFDVFVGSSEGETILSLNNRRPPLNDLRVRRAISHALDRRAIIDGAMYGYGTPIGSHFPPRNPAYVDLTGRYPHDVNEARRLLALAGYPTGFALTLKLPPPSYARRAGEIVAAQLASVGIRASIENLEWSQWIDQVYTRHDFDMSIVAHVEPLDYDIYARDDYYFGYSNPQFKALIAALDAATERAARRELLQQIQRKLADDAVNGFLFQYPRLAVWNRQFSGVGFDNVLGIVDLGQVRYRGPVVAGVGAGVRGEAARSRGAASEAPGAWGSHPLRWMMGALLLALLVLAERRLGLEFLGGRVVVLVATTLIATLIVFVIVEVVPGDPVRYMLGMQADPQTVEALRIQLGLNAGPVQRYATWLIGLAHGDFGLSYTYRIPVGTLIAERIPVSLPLAVYALTIAVLMAFPVGVLSAARRGRPTDGWLSGVMQLGLALPNFWLGMLLVLVFAVKLHWVSAGGFPGWETGLRPALLALTLPAVALAMPQAAILARVLRGELVETLHEDYIRTARAQGAGEWHVLWRHALPNALVPVLTILGLQFAFLLAGAVIIENVFFLPGLGLLVLQAIAQRDLMVVQSVVVLLVVAVVTLSFIVDIAAGFVDPRLRGGRRS